MFSGRHSGFDEVALGECSVQVEVSAKEKNREGEGEDQHFEKKDLRTASTFGLPLFDF